MEKQTNEQTNKTKIKLSITYPARFSKQPQNRTNEKGEGREKSGEEKKTPHTQNFPIGYFNWRYFLNDKKPFAAHRFRSVPQPRSVFKNPGRYNSLF